MPTGAAGHDVDFFCGAKFGFADLHLVEKNVAGIEGDSSKRGFADGARLLVDFLEHEMLEAGLFRHDRVPGHVLHLAPDGPAFKIREIHAGRGDDCEIAIGQEKDIAGVIKDGGNVGSNKVFVIAQADDEWRTVACSHDFVRFVDKNHGQGEDASEFLHGTANGVFQRGAMAIAGFEKMFFDQVSDDFGIGFRGELVAFLDQFLLQAEIVFHDAVMHDDDLAGAVAMRMSIFFGGTAVRGPARVTDAIGPFKGFEANRFFQVAQLAFGAAQLKLIPVAGDGDTRRVIAAVLKSPQALDNDGNYFLFADVANNSTHAGTPGIQSAREQRNSSMTGLVSTSRAIRSTSV